MGIFSSDNVKNNQNDTENPSVENDSNENNQEVPENNQEVEQKTGEDQKTTQNDAVASEIEELKAKLEQKTKQCEEYFSMLQRTAAEFDNYKKRTVKEKEALYSDAVSDAVLAILPVVDNFERAIKAAENDSTTNSSFKEGMELVYKQFKDALKSLGVEEIKALGETFDPQLHNAVMHIEDDSYGTSVVIEEFQKGYILKDKVVRHSMVKVAN